MRRAPLPYALLAPTVLVLSNPLWGCAPPKPTEPETTAVYAEPPAAAPVPVERLSVNEPTPEKLGAPKAEGASSAPESPAADAPAPAAPEAPPPAPASSAPAAATPAAGTPASAAAPAPPAKK